MTNYEIIRSEAINNGIYSEEQIIEWEEAFLAIPLHTFAYWKAHGYSVKKGEHGLATRLWRFKNAKLKEEKTEEQLAVDPADDPAHYYMTKAYLFHGGQVERCGA